MVAILILDQKMPHNKPSPPEKKAQTEIEGPFSVGCVVYKWHLRRSVISRAQKAHLPGNHLPNSMCEVTHIVTLSGETGVAEYEGSGDDVDRVCDDDGSS